MSDYPENNPFLELENRFGEIEGLDSITFAAENETGLNAFQKEDLSNKKQDRLERKKYAGYAFGFLSVFTFLMMLFVFLSGGCFNFKLSDSVLITLITTSLATVVGIFLLVMRYLFR